MPTDYPPLSPQAEYFRDLLQSDNPDPDNLLQELSRAAGNLSVSDAIGLSFWKYEDERSGFLSITNPHALGEGHLWLKFNPQTTSRAIGWEAKSESDKLKVWVDGDRIPIPVDRSGNNVATYPFAWCSARFLSIMLMAVDHPLQDWSENLGGTGSQYSLLIWDTHNNRAIQVEPAVDEKWPHPIAKEVDDHTLKILPDGVDSAPDQIRIIT